MTTLFQQVTRYVSQRVIALEVGLNERDLKAVASGKASRETRTAVNAKLRQFKDGGIYKQSKARGVKTTIKTVFDLPVVKARIARETRKRERQAVSEQAKQTGMLPAVVSGALEAAQAARAEVQAALKGYEAAKDRARREYGKGKRKGETFDAFVKRTTKKDYKRLSEAIGNERKIEKSKPWRKLRSKGLVDYDIDDISDFYPD